MRQHHTFMERNYFIYKACLEEDIKEEDILRLE
jgi:hypothetical protein